MQFHFPTRRLAYKVLCWLSSRAQRTSCSTGWCYVDAGCDAFVLDGVLSDAECSALRSRAEGLWTFWEAWMQTRRPAIRRGDVYWHPAIQAWQFFVTKTGKESRIIQPRLKLCPKRYLRRTIQNALAFLFAMRTPSRPCKAGRDVAFEAGDLALTPLLLR